jgi:tetratricopeptide (TPR) repeat protein
MELSSSGHGAHRLLRNCVLSVFIVTAPVLLLSTTSGAEVVCGSSDSAETVPSEADATEILDEAYECLKAGQKDAAQELVDSLAKSWRAAHSSDSAQLRQLDIWVTAFQNLGQLSSSELEEYDNARTEADEIAELVHRMNGRRLPHGPTLEEAESKLKHIEEEARRCLGSASQTAGNQRSLGMLHACRRDWEAAEKSLESALELIAPDLPSSDREHHITLQWLAWVLMMQDEDFPRQEEYLNSVIEYAESHQGKESNRYWPERAMVLLAEAKYRSGDLGEADRLFGEVRQQLPENPIACRESKCTGACYVSWCLAWCDRHKARKLIAEQKYWDAFHAIDSAVDRLKTGGQRELNLGVTSEDLHCLKAEALCSLGYPQWVDTEMSLANVIAKHAADLRGDVHEPLAGPYQDEANAAFAFRYTKLAPEVVCLRNHEGLAAASAMIDSERRERAEHTLDELSPTASIYDVEAVRYKAIAQVGLKLAFGDFDGALRYASNLHGRLLFAFGADNYDVKCAARMTETIKSLSGLPEKDRQTFCQAYALLRNKTELLSAMGSVYPRFQCLNTATGRLMQARNLFAQLPEPARDFEANCCGWLACAYILQRNWEEAERLLEGICSGPDEYRWLVTDTYSFRSVFALVLSEQAKDQTRLMELLEEQSERLRASAHHDARRQNLLWTASMQAKVGDEENADRIYKRVRSELVSNSLDCPYQLALCDRHCARQLLNEGDLQDACSLIEDVYPRMLVHTKGSLNYPLEVEQTLRLRAEIYERLGRTKDAEADVAYADDIAAHAARLRKMCSADPEQRKKWLARKVDIPSIVTCEEQSKENDKKQSTPSRKWPFDNNAVTTGSYFSPQSSP